MLEQPPQNKALLRKRAGPGSGALGDSWKPGAVLRCRSPLPASGSVLLLCSGFLSDAAMKQSDKERLRGGNGPFGLHFQVTYRLSVREVKVGPQQELEAKPWRNSDGWLLLT